MKKITLLTVILVFAAYAQAHAFGWNPWGVNNSGAYAEIAGNNGFTGDNRFTGSTTLTSDVLYSYPEIKHSPAYVLPLLSNLLPTVGTSKVTFTRSTKASWIDYDGVLRWASPDSPRFGGLRYENGALRETTMDGRPIPLGPGYLGKILFTGDSQGDNIEYFPHRVENFLKGVTIVNDCIWGRSLATIASNIKTTLQTHDPDILVSEGGFNDITAGTSAETILGYAETIVAACVQHGTEPILVELTPFKNHTGWQAAWQAEIDAYNAGLNEMAETYGYKIVKLYQIFEDPSAADEPNPDYVPGGGDLLHWNAVGQQIVAYEILNAINPKYLKGCLFETAQYNYAIYSQEFDQNGAGEWITTNVTTAGDTTAAPDLTTTADTITATAANGTLFQTHTASSDDFVFSVWIERETGSGPVYITVDGGTTLKAVNLTEKPRRFWVRKETANPQFGIQIATSGDAVNAWGGMLESSLFPTSYYPTEASAAQRGADIAYFPSTELGVEESSAVMTIEPLWPSQDNTPVNTYLLQATTSNSMFCRFTSFYSLSLTRYSSSEANQFVVFDNPYLGFLGTGGGADDTATFMAKVGYTTSSSDQYMKLYDDGSWNNTEPIDDFKSGYGTNIYIGCNNQELEQFNGYIKNFAFYNEALTDDQMEELTSWQSDANPF